MVQNELQESTNLVTHVETVSSVGKQASFVDKFQISRALLFDVALFSGVGFLAGFLIRRFASFLIAFVLFCIALLIAQEMGIIMIQVNMNQLFQLLGISVTAPTSPELLIPLLVEWIKSNIVVAIAAVIGFLLGLQAG